MVSRSFSSESFILALQPAATKRPECLRLLFSIDLRERRFFPTRVVAFVILILGITFGVTPIIQNYPSLPYN